MKQEPAETKVRNHNVSNSWEKHTKFN